MLLSPPLFSVDRLAAGGPGRHDRLRHPASAGCLRHRTRGGGDHQSYECPFPPLPAQPAPVVSLPEVLMRAATDSAGTLDGRLITVTGFTMNGAAGADLARVVIICCAADAQLARLHLTGPAAAHFPENTWLRVEGSVVILATLNIVHSDHDRGPRDADRTARQHLRLLSCAEPQRQHIDA